MPEQIALNMPTPSPVQSAIPAQMQPVRTLADLYAWMLRSLASNPNRRSNTRTALEYCLRALNVAEYEDIPSRLIPSLPEKVKDYLKSRQAKPSQFYNYPSLLRRLIEDAIEAHVLVRPKDPLLPDWKASLQKVAEIESAFLRPHFAKLALWASEREIDLTRFDTPATQAFWQSLNSGELHIKHPRSFFRVVRRAWRVASEAGIVPRVEFYSPSPARFLYGIRYDDWPGGLRNEWAGYVKWSTDPFTTERNAKTPKRPATIVSEKGDVSRELGYMRLSGRPVASISLRDLTDLGPISDLLRWLTHRLGDITGTHVHVVSTPLAIAAYFFARLRKHRRDPQFLDEYFFWEDRVQELGKLLQTVQAQMQPRKNKFELLVDLEEFEGVADYILERVARRVKLLKSMKRDPLRDKTIARYIRDALLIRFVANRPFRNKNLREAQLGKNIIEHSDSIVTIHFGSDEMKARNGQDMDFPPVLIELFHDYLSVARPILPSGKNNDYLFVNSKGNPLTAQGVTMLFRKWTATVLGKAFGPHLVRDIVGTAILKYNPGWFVVAQKVLQHKNRVGSLNGAISPAD